MIDSSALLDDRGRVYFGSGDAHLYALDRASGELVWKFEADPVEVVEARYDVDSYNVDWFEGNVAMLADGTLIAPNDNFLVYAIDRDDGSKKGEYLGNELMWSLPAVNTRTGRMFSGSQFMAWRNVYAFDTRSGALAWRPAGRGAAAALSSSMRRQEVGVETTRVAVRLSPRASRTEIAGFEGDELRVRVTAPPVDGRANEALTRLLAKRLGLARGDVRIVAGHGSRQKVVAIDGIAASEVRRRLDSLDN